MHPKKADTLERGDALKSPALKSLAQTLDLRECRSQEVFCFCVFLRRSCCWYHRRICGILIEDVSADDTPDQLVAGWNKFSLESE